MEQSRDNVLGFRAVGEVTKEDYATLVPAVAAAIKQYATIRVLFDLSDFKREKAVAWGADLGFGREYHDKIERMALVGDRSWGRGQDRSTLLGQGRRVVRHGRRCLDVGRRLSPISRTESTRR